MTVTVATPRRYFGTPDVGYRQRTLTRCFFEIMVAVHAVRQRHGGPLPQPWVLQAGRDVTVLSTLGATVMLGPRRRVELVDPAGAYSVVKSAYVFGKGSTVRLTAMKFVGSLVAWGAGTTSHLSGCRLLSAGPTTGRRPPVAR